MTDELIKKSDRLDIDENMNQKLNFHALDLIARLNKDIMEIKFEDKKNNEILGYQYMIKEKIITFMFGSFISALIAYAKKDIGEFDYFYNSLNENVKLIVKNSLEMIEKTKQESH